MNSETQPFEAAAAISSVQDAGAAFDPGSIEHDPGLYAEVGTAASLHGLDAVDEEALAQYDRDGFLSIEGAFTPEEITAALEGINDLVMGRYPGYKGILYESKARDILPTLPLESRLDAVRKCSNFVKYEPRLHALAFHPKLISVVRRILGEEPRLSQDMALIKPPHIGREKPWHQDHAYFNLPLGTRVVGIWIAIDEATSDNGCMRFLSGGHKEGPRIHFKRRDWQLCDREMMGCRPVAAPLKPGGLVIFDGLAPHGTPTNHSPKRRRALQYHYCGKSVQETTAQERLAIFGSEGKDVTC